MDSLNKNLVRLVGSGWNSPLSKKLISSLSRFLKFDSNSSGDAGANFLFVPICYPFVSLAEITRSNAQKLPVVSVVFDSLALSQASEILPSSSLAICFSKKIRTQILSMGLDRDKVCLLNFPIHFKGSRNFPDASVTKIAVSASRLKKDNVDSLLSLAYLASQNSDTLEINLFGSSLDKESQGFSKYLRDQVKLKGLSKSLKFVDFDFDSHNAVETLRDTKYSILFNCSKQNEVESLNLCVSSLDMGIPVLIEDSIWNDNNLLGTAVFSGIDASTAAENLYSMIFSEEILKDLRSELIDSADNLTLEGSILERLNQLDFQKPTLSTDKVEAPAIISLSNSIPKILLQNRSNAFTQPGGDTVVMEKLLSLYPKDRFDLDVCVDGSKDVRGYDLVHLFNFAIREITENQARNAKSKNVPYLVTTLYEDWPSFYNQMATMYLALKAYVEHGQPISNWERYQEAGKIVTPSDAWDNSYSANNAEVLISTGKSESAALLKDYPASKLVKSIPLGCEVTEFFDGGKLFKDKFGLSDFILCVGRLEWRKNQLMLLKALEDIDVTVVFAASSFTYQPEYEALCRNFKRRGKTVFLSRLTEEELASAYQAAKVHALPSWYELPGLVSLEAARYGTPVVVTNNGTTRDYLGDSSFYCSPDDASSIRDAVLSAFHSQRYDIESSVVKNFTWESSVNTYANTYSDIINDTLKNVVQASEVQPKSALINSIEVIVEDPKQSLNFDSTKNAIKFCDDGDAFSKNGDFVSAKNSYQSAIDSDPNYGRSYRSLGALSLLCSIKDEASFYFEKALEIDPYDCKALLGRGAVLWEEGRKLDAFDLYKQASDISPGDASAMLYLVNSAYELNKLNDLEGCLRKYLRQNPSDKNIQYCLAGCYYKQEKYSASLGVLERLFAIEENHADGRELKKLIEDKMNLNSQPSFEDDQVEPLIIKKVIAAPIISYTQPLLTGVKELAELDELKATRQYVELIEKADVLLKNEKYCDTALDHFDLLKAESLGCIGEVEQAKAILLELKSRDVQLSRVLSDLGALALADQLYSEADNYFEASLREDKTNDTAFAGLAMCAQAEGRLEDAWTLFEETLRKNSQNIQAIYGLVQLGYEFDRLSQVETFLREYLEFKPIDISILYSLAGCLYAQGKSQEAVGELKNILLFDPTNVPALELIEKIKVEDNISSN